MTRAPPGHERINRTTVNCKPFSLRRTLSCTGRRKPGAEEHAVTSAVGGLERQSAPAPGSVVRSLALFAQLTAANLPRFLQCSVHPWLIRIECDRPPRQAGHPPKASA